MWSLFLQIADERRQALGVRRWCGCVSVVCRVRLWCLSGAAVRNAWGLDQFIRYILVQRYEAELLIDEPMSLACGMAPEGRHHALGSLMRMRSLGNSSMF